MPQPVVITPAQQGLIAECQTMSARFTDNAQLVRDSAVIEQARTLIGRAVDADLPQVVITPLQIWVSTYDNNMGLPERLRIWPD